MSAPAEPPPAAMAPLREIAREWGRIGCVGFGGPPAHIALLRELCVRRRRWLTDEDFENAIAATNLLPGPGSTQLAIYCAWRVGGLRGALVGGAGFIVPGLVAILALAAVFLSGSAPAWVRGAGAGAGAAVAAVAVQAGTTLLGPGWRRARQASRRARWLAYVALGAAAAATVGGWLVVVLIACGLVELGRRHLRVPGEGRAPAVAWPLLPLAAASAGTLGALAWVSFKVGALSYGGGFVIVPLMQADAVHNYGWLTSAEFLNAVALGQVTPGPVVHTVAAVGYAAAGVAGGLVAAAVAFAPSFTFILLGAERFDRLRRNPTALAFLDGAGAAAVGAILGSAIPLARALEEPWQYGVLIAGALALFVLRRGVVFTLVAAGLAGALLGLAGVTV